MASSRIYQLFRNMNTLAHRGLSIGTINSSTIIATRHISLISATNLSNGWSNGMVIPASLTKMVPQKKPSLIQQQRRTFFNESSLMLNQFIKRRDTLIEDYGETSAKFFSRLNEILAQPNPGKDSPLYSGDLATAIYLCDGSDEQLGTVLNLVKHFLKTTSDEVPYPYFSVSRNTSLLMQLMHHLKRPDIVSKLFLNENEFENFIQAAGMRTLELAVDLLYREGKYQEVLDIFSLCMKKAGAEKVPLRLKDVLLVVVCACYNLGVPEAYKIALHHICSGNPPPRFRFRSHTVTAFMAVKYGEPAVALNLLSSTNGTRFAAHASVFNLRIKALADLGRSEEALVTMKQIASAQGESQFTADVIEAVKVRIEESNDPVFKEKFDKLSQELQSAGKISSGSLESVFQRIMATPFEKTQFVRDKSLANMGVSNRDRGQGRFNRDNDAGRFNRDNNAGRFNRDNNAGRFNRDNNAGRNRTEEGRSPPRSKSMLF